MIKPYKLGKDLYYNGNILPVFELSRVKIVLTDKSHEEELKIVQDESYREVQKFNRSNSGIIRINAGRGYQDYEVEDCGKDVTTKYLSQGPGSGTILSNIVSAIKHPWIVRIFGGLLFLIAVAIIAYFGLK